MPNYVVIMHDVITMDVTGRLEGQKVIQQYHEFLINSKAFILMYVVLHLA